MVLITFVGDFQSATTVTFSGGGKGRIMTVIDQTSKNSVRVHMPPGVLAEFADMCKAGQVLQITGFTPQLGGYGPPTISAPMVIRAQSGTNEADLNDLAARWMKELNDAVMGGGALKTAQDALELMKLAHTKVADELRETRKKLEVKDHELQYERLLNGALKED